VRVLLAIALIATAGSASADHVPIDVALKMRGPAMAAAGAEVTYSIDLTTLFPGAAYAVTDVLPLNTRLVRATGEHWNCIESKDKVTCGNERLDSGSSTIDITFSAPNTPQTITNAASVQSISVVDPFPDNNSDSITTLVYDAAVCATRTIQALTPIARAAVVGPHVTFRWSPVSAASRYQLYAAEGSSVLTLRASTTDTEIVRDFDAGEVQWYVSAVMPDCPPVSTDPQTFRVAAAAPRGRAAHH